jgi:hypothetical protein
LEVRRSGKHWIQAIHRSGGWTPDMPLIRVENRLTREIFREIAAGLGLNRGDWCDDPWKALDHLSDFWGYSGTHSLSACCAPAQICAPCSA